MDKNWAPGQYVEKGKEITTVWEIKAINDKGYKSLDSSKGLVISDYQTDLEKQWLKHLHSKYKVKVSKGTIKKYISSFE